MDRRDSPTPDSPDDARDDNGDQEGDAAPLAGVVLCCTSIPPEQRDSLADAAREMGAVTKLDLTSDVTHLIVGDTNTPKYKYVAKERRDIRILSATWLHAVREAWLAGKDVDLDDFDRAHRLPTFYNLRICVTGFENLQERNALTAAIDDNGAEYRGDLTRDVTHLVAAAPKGKKYEYAGQWGIRIVGLEWMEQSLRRGMVLDESLFNPVMPPEERGKGAIAEHSQPRPVLGKRSRSDGFRSKETGRRKLRRTMSTKLESQTGDIWADIGSGETPSAKAGPAEWEDSGADRTDQPAQNDTARGNTGAVGRESAADDKALDSNSPQGPFAGERISIRGFGERQTTILRDTLLAGGADIVSRDSVMHEGVTTVVPHAADPKLLDEVRGRPGHSVVSEFWVERCIHTKTREAKTSTVCQPLGQAPIEGFDKITVCPTSFAGIDLLHFSKAMRLMGAQYNEMLTRETTVLVCGPDRPNKRKLEYALAHDIPIVQSTWAWNCINKHRLEDINKHKSPRQRGGIEKVEKGIWPLERAGQESGALREITPHANSQARRQNSPASDSESLEAALCRSRQSNERAIGNENAGVEEQTERMKEAIEQLQRHKKESSLGNAASAGRRQRRHLGRVQSNPSSLGVRTASVSEAAESFLNAHEEDELAPQAKEETRAGGFRPSQTLTYEHEESAAARAQFMKRIASGHEKSLDAGSQGKRVESIGTVKDTHRDVGDGGGGGVCTRKALRRR